MLLAERGICRLCSLDFVEMANISAINWNSIRRVPLKSSRLKIGIKRTINKMSRLLLCFHVPAGRGARASASQIQFENLLPKVGRRAERFL